MAKYTVTVTLDHSWTSLEEHEITVHAASPETALEEAKRKALDTCDPDRSAAEIDFSDIHSAVITSVIDDASDDNPPRCNQTIDMFAGAQS